MAETTVERKKRGFATMPAEKQREIASMGGKSIPAAKRTFSVEKEIAREAGSKGGIITAQNRKRKSD